MEVVSVSNRVCGNGGWAALAAAALVAAGLLGFPAGLARAQGGLAVSDAQNNLFPDGFVGMALGTTQSELLRLRPAIKEGGFKGDNVGHPKMMVEQVNSAFVDRAIYLFGAPTAVLTGVVYIKSLPAADPVPSVRSFRAAVLRKWGMPNGVGVVRGDAGDRQLALVWRRKDGVVVASYPSDLATTTSNSGRARSAVVRIGSLGSEVDTLADQRDPLDADISRKLDAELRDDLVRGSSAVFR